MLQKNGSAKICKKVTILIFGFRLYKHKLSHTNTEIQPHTNTATHL